MFIVYLLEISLLELGILLVLTQCPRMSKNKVKLVEIVTIHKYLQYNS